MAIVGTFKVEKDPFYKDGIRKGIQKGEAIGRHEEALVIALEMKKD